MKKSDKFILIPCSVITDKYTDIIHNSYANASDIEKFIKEHNIKPISKTKLRELAKVNDTVLIPTKDNKYLSAVVQGFQTEEVLIVFRNILEVPVGTKIEDQFRVAMDSYFNEDISKDLRFIKEI